MHQALADENLLLINELELLSQQIGGCHRDKAVQPVGVESDEARLSPVLELSHEMSREILFNVSASPSTMPVGLVLVVADKPNGVPGNSQQQATVPR